MRADIAVYFLSGKSSGFNPPKWWQSSSHRAGLNSHLLEITFLGKTGSRLPIPPIPPSQQRVIMQPLLLFWVQSSALSFCIATSSLGGGVKTGFAPFVYLSTTRISPPYSLEIPNGNKNGSCPAEDGGLRMMCAESPLFLTAYIGRNENLLFSPK